MGSKRQADAEARIRAAMPQLLAGQVPEGIKVDVQGLCTLSGVPRATLYRTYPHLKAEFEDALGRVREASGHPDPRAAQIERLKSEVAGLRRRISAQAEELVEATEFRKSALSRLAAQHEEILALRRDLEAKHPPPVPAGVTRLRSVPSHDD